MYLAHVQLRCYCLSHMQVFSFNTGTLHEYIENCDTSRGDSVAGKKSLIQKKDRCERTGLFFNITQHQICLLFIVMLQHNINGPHEGGRETWEDTLS